MTRTRTLLTLVLVVAGAFAQANPASRSIKYGPRDVITLSAKLRYTTLIVLPAEEKILDYIIGDRDYWQLEGAGNNHAYLKPAKAGAETTVTLVCASGAVYSFVAREGAGEPDIKVFVEPAEEKLIHSLAGPMAAPATPVATSASTPYVAGVEADALRAALDQSQAALSSAEETFALTYPQQVAWDYRFEKNEKPFLVSQIWHDSRATYIRCAASEKPTLYELKDGAPVLVNYELKGDTYVVPKILDEGYLALGKKTLTFRRGL